MQIISFATEETDWQTPRMGILLEARGYDMGYRLDCEKLFEKNEQPADPLAWFDMDGPWFQKARETQAPSERRDDAGLEYGSTHLRVPVLIEFLSQSITLEPGDVIATGTPSGVGFARKPPVFLKPGDQMEVLIEGIGGIGNPVISETG